MNNNDFTYLQKSRVIGGRVYIYAKVQGYYGWYALEASEAPVFADAETEGLYACDTCADDIEKGGITDDEGHLALTGTVNTFYSRCSLCGDTHATHEVTHAQEVR